MPVLLTSGYRGSLDDALTRLQGQPVTVLPKPYSRDPLLAAVRTMLVAPPLRAETPVA